MGLALGFPTYLNEYYINHLSEKRSLRKDFIGNPLLSNKKMCRLLMNRSRNFCSKTKRATLYSMKRF